VVSANWALVIATIVLAVITFFYMRHTRRLADDTNRMADDTRRMADAVVQESKSQIASNIPIEKRGGSFAGNYGSQDYDLINKGASPVRVSKFVLQWWYKRSPDKIYTMAEVLIDKLLGAGESQLVKIPINKSDMVKDDFQESKNLSLHQLRGLAKGRAYAIYIDRNGNEGKTRDFPIESLF
jgi:hypothetical protein